MKVLFVEKSNDELVREYKKLVQLEQITSWDQCQQADEWERIWLKVVKARRAIIEMALKEREINVEEVQL